MNNALQLERRIKEHRKIDGFIGTSSNPEPPVPVVGIIPVNLSFGGNTSSKLESLVRELVPYTSSYTNMQSMFCNILNNPTLDFTSWDTSNVTDMSGMFTICISLTSLDLSSFNTSNVTKMHLMFAGCDALTSLNLSSFDTSRVTNMEEMFTMCNYLTSLDLSNFHTSNVTNMMGMFSYCQRLSHLDIRNFDFSNVTTYTDIFVGVPVDCEIIVKDQTAKDWVLARRPDFTNVTIA